MRINGRKERKREAKREKERIREIKERSRERKERKQEKKVSMVNYYQSAFNSQKEKLYILAEMLEIQKSGCACGSIYYNRPPSL